MADSELDAIRARRMAELQKEQGEQGGANRQQQQQEAVDREETMKNSILAQAREQCNSSVHCPFLPLQVLDQDARARLANIAVAKPDKARMLENTIIQMARH